MTDHRSAVLALLLLSASPAVAQAQIHAELVAGGFDRPLGMVADPTQAGVLYVIEQSGRIRSLRNGQVIGVFLDLSDQVSVDAGEGGLLGMALAPDYAASGRVFVNFTDRAENTVIARFTRSA